MDAKDLDPKPDADDVHSYNMHFVASIKHGETVTAGKDLSNIKELESVIRGTSPVAIRFFFAFWAFAGRERVRNRSGVDAEKMQHGSFSWLMGQRNTVIHHGQGHNYIGHNLGHRY